MQRAYYDHSPLSPHSWLIQIAALQEFALRGGWRYNPQGMAHSIIEKPR